MKINGYDDINEDRNRELPSKNNFNEKLYDLDLDVSIHHNTAANVPSHTQTCVSCVLSCAYTCAGSCASCMSCQC